MKRRHFLGTSALAGLPFISRAETGYLKEGDESYDASRQLFNSDLSPKPAFIAACRTQDEVAKAVLFSREKDLAVSVKSGGHCFIGSSMSEGSLVIDLGEMSQRVYLPETQKLIAGPGVRLGELYDVLLPQGRILPAGSCAGVGLGGLTLGGGYGLFARQWGLTCDHLERVKMVNGLGEVVDSNDDPDLLWACRGGGNGNFGVITSMEFQTRPARPTFGAQRFIARGFSKAQAVRFMASWFEITAKLAEPIFSAFVFNGKQISILLTTSYTTSGPAFQKAAKALTQAGFEVKRPTNSPIARALKRYYGQKGPLPFYNVSGGYYHGFSDVENSADLIAERVMGTSGLILQVNTLGGAITRGPGSAYPHREFPFMGEIQGYWERKSAREKLIAHVTELRQAIGAKAHYRNYPDPTLENPSEGYYGDSLPKLKALKARYDPDNVIRHAQSI
ncbi:FAD-binding oxidoreductase [Akkermansiaceae bacterium]|nr:FAD-binding oxidoreductase [Akkermansiaceae bacterium]